MVPEEGNLSAYVQRNRMRETNEAISKCNLCDLANGQIHKVMQSFSV